MLYGLPPYSGIRESTIVTWEPSSTSFFDRCEPMKPRPPVTSAWAPWYGERDGRGMGGMLGATRRQSPAFQVVKPQWDRVVGLAPEGLKGAPVPEPTCARKTSSASAQK